MKNFIYLQIFIVLLGLFVNFWVLPSVITSSIKAISGNCNHTYPVEIIWDGNWFCSIDK